MNIFDQKLAKSAGLCYDAAMSETTRATILLPTAELDALRDLARDLGHTSASGPRTGEGNITALVRAIAHGDLVVRVPESNGNGGDDLGEAFEQLSRALAHVQGLLEARALES